MIYTCLLSTDVHGMLMACDPRWNVIISIAYFEFQVIILPPAMDAGKLATCASRTSSRNLSAKFAYDPNHAQLLVLQVGSLVISGSRRKLLVHLRNRPIPQREIVPRPL